MTRYAAPCENCRKVKKDKFDTELRIILEYGIHAEHPYALFIFEATDIT